MKVFGNLPAVKAATYVYLLIGIMLLSNCVTEEPPLYKGHIIEKVKAEKINHVYALDSPFVKPVLYLSVPDLSNTTISIRKQTFIEIMVPALLIAHDRNLVKIDRLEQVLKKISDGGGTDGDSLYLDNLFRKYASNDTADLMRRMELPPVSLALAQAAIESGWGTSRFFHRGNNIFGVWSYNVNEPRLMAKHGRMDQPVFVRKYNNILESINDYHLVLARGSAYKQFRATLMDTKNPYQLAGTLSRYSELRNEYVRRIKTVIRVNKLTEYDNYKLDPEYKIVP